MNIVGGALLFFVAWFLVTCLASFCVMMGVDNMHDWWSFIPTMSFWESFSITAWFAIPLGLYTGYSRTQS